MNRITEPELMNDDEQALAYAQADFAEPHNRVIELFIERFGTKDIQGHVLDLGCGPGDISFRFARAYPGCVVHGIDGAEAMLRCGLEILDRSPDIRDRVKLIHGFLPDFSPPLPKYDVVISNSLLHHLGNPSVLWQAVKLYSSPGAPIFIVDLMRPSSPDEAGRFVDKYSGNEPEILKRDFYNSLLAAFETDEIKTQLRQHNLDCLDVEAISDRHLLVSGFFKP